MNTVSQEEKTWGMIGHLSALSCFLIPFGSLLGPLVVWLVKKDTMPFAADQAKESLNFQITVTLALIVSGLLIFVLIGMLLLPVVAIAALVLTVIGGLKANEGELYRYPFTLRLVS